MSINLCGMVLVVLTAIFASQTVGRFCQENVTKITSSPLQHKSGNVRQCGCFLPQWDLLHHFSDWIQNHKLVAWPAISLTQIKTKPRLQPSEQTCGEKKPERTFLKIGGVKRVSIKQPIRFQFDHHKFCLQTTKQFCLASR